MQVFRWAALLDLRLTCFRKLHPASNIITTKNYIVISSSCSNHPAVTVTAATLS